MTVDESDLNVFVVGSSRNLPVCAEARSHTKKALIELFRYWMAFSFSPWTSMMDFCCYPRISM